MNPEIKKQWLAALKSGEYEQGVGQLYRCDERDNYLIEYHCVLGVLCDLGRQAKVVELNIDGTYGAMHHTMALPKEVREWSGVSAWFADKLSAKNDRDGLTFAEMAKLIEEVL